VHPDGSKAPVGLEWQKRATSDPEKVVALWADGHHADWIGMAGGQGLVWIDPDDYKPECAVTMAKFEAKLGTLPPTLTHGTLRGGRHLGYTYDPALYIGCPVLGPGVEIKGEGGQVVAPPSPGYTLQDPRHPVALPAAWVQYLVMRSAKETEDGKPRFTDTGPMSDEIVEALARKAKNGVETARLLDGNHDKKSEDRGSLVMRLAFYTQDAEQILRIVWGAGFDRDQDDERKILTQDIPSALRKTTETYSAPAPIVHRSGETCPACTYGVLECIREAPSPVDPDAEPVTDPAALLDEVAAFVGKYVAATPDQLVAITLWAMHAHVFDAFDTSPRLALLSAEKQSGKTRTLEVLNLLTPSALFVSNISAAAMFRVIEQRAPTILFDEVDAIFGSKTEDDHEDLRSLLNTGHRRGATVPRCVGQGSKMTVHEFPTYAPVALAAIGKLPDTLMDRSVVIRMKRRAPDEKVSAYRQRRVEPSGHALRARIAAWAAQILESLREADPAMPNGVTDRPADTWEPLLAIADAAGGSWPERARQACVALLGSEKSESGSEGVRLLTDIRDVFDAENEDTIASNDLAHELKVGDESEWADLGYGRSLDARGLARRLRKYGIRPHQMRNPKGGSYHVQGYARYDFVEAWSRYLVPVAADAPTRPYVLADLDVSDVPF
jgi:hypothetical protein